MERPESPPWLDWARRLQAIAQNGLAYASDPFDIERFEATRAIAAEILARASGLPVPVVVGILDRDSGYATPKIDTRGVVFRDNRILLVRERSEGLWTLPGGWADPCASPAENVTREIREESGFQTEAVKLLAVWDREKHPHEPPYAFHIYKLFILCRITGGSEALSEETDGVGFFAEDDLPPLSLRRVLPAQIRRMFEHHHRPDLPTDMDLPARPCP